jgi:UDP-3-O-[3-hydroxymyristoyl] glucosamine N-acyltransferase
VHVAHNCIFKKQNTICAGVIFEGSVTLGKNNFIGLNVTIKNKIKIGNNNLIGAGSNVVKNIRNEKIIYGNPAK